MDVRTRMAPPAARNMVRIGLLLLLAVASLVLAAGSSLAQGKGDLGSQGASAPLPAPLAPLERVLNPDGTVNTSAGYNGAYDPNGWRMVLDHNGRPHFVRANAPDSSVKGLEPWQQTVDSHQGTYPAKPSAADDNWDNRFGTRGPNQPVYAVALLGGNVYVGGTFSNVDGVTAYGVAKWNGSTWSTLGGGIYGSVYAMAVRGTDLYVGGYFAYAINSSGPPLLVHGIAKWDGSNWSALGTGIGTYGLVYAMAFDSAGKLYVGGSFTNAGGVSVHDVAMWDGSWHDVGGGITAGTSNYVEAIVTKGTNVYIGGQFTSAGATPASGIAMWNGSTWSALGTGVTYGSSHGYVYALAADSTYVYAAGFFMNAGGVPVHNIARWDGSAWSDMGGGATGGGVYALLVRADGVYAGGNFATMGGVTAHGLARWDGSAWHAVNGGVTGYVNALASDGLNLYTGGNFSSAGNTIARNMARWNGSQWNSMGGSTDEGPNSSVVALLADGNDVYVGGYFERVGRVQSEGTARWDGNKWNPLGTGIYGAVDSLAKSGNDIYAGGYIFGAPDAPSAMNIVRWDGTHWNDLGGGVQTTGYGYSEVYAVAVSGSKVYVGGVFNQAGSTTVSNIAMWDGSAWHDVGGGANNAVYALSVIGTDLYAGGYFTVTGGLSVSNIAKWNGSTWSALGTGVTETGNPYGAVYALANDGTNLYVGGYFNSAGGTAVNNLARWDGSWHDLGGGTASTVEALTFNGSNLYVGGYFSTVGGTVAADGIAKWNGSSWSAFGSGTDNGVYAVAVTANGDVAVGGVFTAAGGKPANNFSIWHAVPQQAGNFADVASGSTFYPFIHLLAERGIVSGYACGGPGEPCNATHDPYYRYGNQVTRGQLSKIVANSAGFIDDVPVGQQSYADIAPGSTFWVYIERLSSRNVMSGYACGNPGEPCDGAHRPYFRPGANVTRGQTAKIVANAAGLNNVVPAGQQTYADVLPGSTFWAFIERLSSRGVMSGYACGNPGEPCDGPHRPYFRPGADVTRGQSAKIVANTFFAGSLP